MNESEKYAFIKDCNGRVFMFEIERVFKRCFLTTGWRDFMHASGAKEGDFMCVTITSIDDADITIFKLDGMQRFPIIDAQEEGSQSAIGTCFLNFYYFTIV